MHVCGPVCTGSLRSVYACMEDRGTLAVFLYCFLSIFFQWGFLTEPGLASEFQGSVCLHLQLWGYWPMPVSGCWASEFISSLLYSKHPPPSHLHSPLRMVNRCIDFHQIHRPKFTQAAPICLYLLDPYFESFLRISFCCVGNTDDSVVPLAVLCSALQIRIADKAALLDRPCLCICSQLVDCPWGVRAHRRQDLRPELCLIWLTLNLLLAHFPQHVIASGVEPVWDGITKEPG